MTKYTKYHECAKQGIGNLKLTNSYGTALLVSKWDDQNWKLEIFDDTIDIDYCPFCGEKLLLEELK